MPACSPCGYAVDFLRSCYKATRSVFRNAPEIALPGRYYFCGEETPHYPGVHWYGSNIWMRGDLEHNPPLGERQRLGWDNGRPPDRRPLPVLVGSTECMAQGDEWPVPGDLPRTVIDGVDSRCFALTFDADVFKFGALAAIDAPALQATYARLVELVYEEEFAEIESILTLWFGAPVTMTSFPAGPVMPARAYVNFGGQGWLVLVSGTTTPQQLALEAFASLAGPANFGAYATNAIWNHTASVMAGELFDAGADSDQPIVLAGHSYGAAVASLLAARYRFWQPTREISLLTMGLPKPGDARVVFYVNLVRHTSIAGIDDLVVALPPDLMELLPFNALLPVGLTPQWNRWREVPSYVILRANGEAAPGRPVFLDAGILGPMLADVLAGIPLASIEGHPIEVYRDRLWLRQPFAAWPVPPLVFRALFPIFHAHGGAIGAGLAGDLGGAIVADGGGLGDGAAE